MTEVNCRVRRATVVDAGVIARYRAAMMRDAGMADEEEAAAIEAASLPILSEMLARGEFLGWLAECDGQVVACGGLMMRRLLPRPGALQGGEEAYILNVYTEPEYRRRGLAGKLMEKMIAWSRERGCARVTLHTSEDGRSLYESLGFVRTDEMRLK
ncbi:MAG TPA: GNAT family N-acetyltransferase [Blastocatellia bacterium]|nr:GNAT family N-acetyltransferase [Blastocatellia bacterium]